ncbi:MAG: arsenite methyltransferase [Planctomycetota bacterium]|jgi:arsenite methyltransferase
MTNQETNPAPDADTIRARVRTDYARVAETAESSSESSSAAGCCAPGDRDSRTVSRELGYSEEELDAAPEGANLGLGCGNPQAIASLQPGESVLDLGSGAGFDAFLAARRVGEQGHVVGVDMTHEMIAKARSNKVKLGLTQTEFRLGEIEALPVGDATVDVIISNCVINLSPEKPRVFAEAMRVLRPGGRLAISDVVLTADLPDEVRDDLANLTACVSGAATIEELQSTLRDAGFADIAIEPIDASKQFIKDWVPGSDASAFAVSASITAKKPGGCCPPGSC